MTTGRKSGDNPTRCEPGRGRENIGSAAPRFHGRIPRNANLNRVSINDSQPNDPLGA